MSLNKIINNNKKKSEIESEDEIDDEIEDELEDELDELDNELEDELDDTIEDNQITEKKEKPKKLTHEEIILEINKIIEAENILETEISDLEKTLAVKIKLRTTYRKNKTKYIGLLPKAYQDSINKIRKEKKKKK